MAHKSYRKCTTRYQAISLHVETDAKRSPPLTRARSSEPTRAPLLAASLCLAFTSAITPSSRSSRPPMGKGKREGGGVQIYRPTAGRYQFSRQADAEPPKQLHLAGQLRKHSKSVRPISLTAFAVKRRHEMRTFLERSLRRRRSFRPTVTALFSTSLFPPKRLNFFSTTMSPPATWYTILS